MIPPFSGHHLIGWRLKTGTIRGDNGGDLASLAACVLALYLRGVGAAFQRRRDVGQPAQGKGFIPAVCAVWVSPPAGRTNFRRWRGCERRITPYLAVVRNIR
jgi:hypothetical protein